MIWTPSPRPPWSERLMNSTLRDATAFMAYLSPIQPLSPAHRVGGAMTSKLGPWSPTRSASRQSAEEQQECYQNHQETHPIGARHPDSEDGKRGAERSIGEPLVSVTFPAFRPCA